MKLTTKNELTEAERTRLAELEPVVKMGMANFVVVGKALLEISDSRLYREKYSTFKEYVETTYDMSVSRAYQLCEHAEVIKSISGVQHVGELNPRQTAELARVKPKKREKVLEKARAKAESENRDVTSKDIEIEAEKIAPKNIQTDAFKKLARSINITPEITPLSAFTRLVDDAMAVIPASESTVLPYRNVLEDRAARLANRDQESKNKTAYA